MRATLRLGFESGGDITVGVGVEVAVGEGERVIVNCWLLV